MKCYYNADGVCILHFGQNDGDFLLLRRLLLIKQMTFPFQSLPGFVHQQVLKANEPHR